MPACIMCPSCGEVVDFDPADPDSLCPDCWACLFPNRKCIVGVDLGHDPLDPVIGVTDGGTGILWLTEGRIGLPEYRAMPHGDVLAEIDKHLEGTNTYEYLDRYTREKLPGKTQAICNRAYQWYEDETKAPRWWRRLRWFLLNRDFCPRCGKVTSWDFKLLYNDAKDTQPYGEAYTCTRCRIEVLTTEDCPVPTYGNEPVWRAMQ